MKRVATLASVLLLVGWASGVEAQLTGSPHNFLDDTIAGASVTEDWNTGTLCGPCHTPHGGSSTAPLWNHTASGETFTAYTAGPNTDHTPGAPSGVSLLCLGCHDGATALDAYAGGAGTSGYDMATWSSGAYDASIIGTDLSASHPVSFSYATGGSGLDTQTNAEADGITTDDIIRTLLADTPVDDADPSTTRRMDAVMR